MKVMSLVLIVFASFGTTVLLQAQDNALTNSSSSRVPPPGPVSKRQPGVNATKVTIVFTAIPPVRAWVTWGKTPLGIIPRDEYLVVVRSRDSGPLDVIVRAKGFLPVQTRAYTFSDQNVAVKLTPLDNKSELFGYRVPLDAGVDASPDAAQANIQNLSHVNQGSSPPQAAPAKSAPSAPAPKSAAPSPPEKKPWYKFW